MGHARAYLSLETRSAQEAAHKEVIKMGLSVRQTEALVKKLKEGSGEKKKEKQTLNSDKAQLIHLSSELQKKLGARVRIQSKGEKGTILIEYCSPDDFERLYDMLRG